MYSSCEVKDFFGAHLWKLCVIPPIARIAILYLVCNFSRTALGSLVSFRDKKYIYIILSFSPFLTP